LLLLLLFCQKKNNRIDDGEHFLNIFGFLLFGFLRAKNQKYLKSVHVEFTEKKLQCP